MGGFPIVVIPQLGVLYLKFPESGGGEGGGGGGGNLFRKLFDSLEGFPILLIFLNFFFGLFLFFFFFLGASPLRKKRERERNGMERGLAHDRNERRC